MPYVNAIKDQILFTLMSPFPSTISAFFRHRWVSCFPFFSRDVKFFQPWFSVYLDSFLSRGRVECIDQVPNLSFPLSGRILTHTIYGSLKHLIPKAADKVIRLNEVSRNKVPGLWPCVALLMSWAQLSRTQSDVQHVNYRRQSHCAQVSRR